MEAPSESLQKRDLCESSPQMFHPPGALPLQSPRLSELGDFMRCLLFLRHQTFIEVGNFSRSVFLVVSSHFSHKVSVS